MYKIIYSEEQIKLFFNNVMQNLLNGELYFIAMAARNKYLSDDEKNEYMLGRSEMFSRELIMKYDYNYFISRIRRFECNEGGYLTKNYKCIPQKSIVCYANINPSSILKGLTKFKKDTDDFTNDILYSYTKGSVPDFSKLNSIHSKFETSFQNVYSRKTWLDIDMDLDKKSINIVDVFNYLYLNGIKTKYLIETKNGYHLLIKTSELKFNPNDIINFIKNKTNNKEIVINRNGMIPLPGTLQGNYKVKFYE